MSLQNLRKIKAFAGLDESQLREINARICWEEFPINLSIISHHDGSHDVYFIASGLVKATSYAVSGKEITYQHINSGEMFGEISCIDQLDRLTNVVVIEKCLAGQLNCEDFWWLMESFPSVVKSLLIRLSGLVRVLSNRVYEQGIMGVSDRIRAEIIRVAQQNLVQENYAVIPVMLTHEEIASRVSTHREAVTKEIGLLSKHGIIRKHRRKMIVPDMRRLESLIAGYF